MELEFLVVNSFTDKPFGGNPAAVFLRASGLEKNVMQSIARQMNLVETVFVSSPEDRRADFRLRYFTPDEELPVAGHPTVAACVALVKRGILNPADGEYVIETGKGFVKIAVYNRGGEPSVVMEQPSPLFGEVLGDRGEAAAILGISEGDLLPELPVAPVDTGLGHLIVPVKSLSALMRIRRNIAPLLDLCGRHGVREVQAFAFEAYDKSNHLHTRNICPREGLEDPACGNGCGALGAYLARYHFQNQQTHCIRAEQGHIVNMPAVIEIAIFSHGDSILVTVGGTGRLMIEGKLYL